MTITIHHLDCGSMCPPGGRLLLGEHKKIICHCLLLELADGLALVDTGLGLMDVQDPRRLGRRFRALVRPQLEEQECALRRVEQLGFDGRDVRHLLMTHLDVDHAGGIADFPHATVHVMRREKEAALDPEALSPWQRDRYRSAHFAHEVRWDLRDLGGERWMGFSQVVRPAGLPPEILMVPLAGHSLGHAAIAVQTSEGWLLHAGDAYFHRAEVRPEQGPIPVGLRVFPRVMQADAQRRVENVRRLREMAAAHPEISVFCAHDPVELETLRSR